MLKDNYWLGSGWIQLRSFLEIALGTHKSQHARWRADIGDVFETLWQKQLYKLHWTEIHKELNSNANFSAHYSCIFNQSKATTSGGRQSRQNWSVLRQEIPNRLQLVIAWVDHFLWKKLHIARINIWGTQSAVNGSNWSSLRHLEKWQL